MLIGFKERQDKMSKVKGGKVENFDIRVRKPVTVWLTRLVILVIIGLGGAVAFYYGQEKGFADEVEAQKVIDTLAEQLLTKTSQLAQLTQQHKIVQEQYSHLALAAQIDASQVEAFRLKDVEQYEEINELEAHLEFYQSIMSPSDMKKGLTIEQFEIIEGDTLKAILTQVTDKPIKITGAFQVSITGLLNDETKVYKLSNVSAKSDSVKFGFKFFQSFSIDLTMPEGFVPQSVELVAKQTSSKSKAITKVISWPSAN